VKELEHHKTRLERKRLRLVTAAQSLAERINGKTVKIEGRAGEGGKLYGSVTTSDIAQALMSQYDVVVDRRKIHLNEPIRTIGGHSVDIAFMGDTRAVISVNVFDPAQKEVKIAPAVAEVAAVAEAIAPITDDAVVTAEVATSTPAEAAPEE